MSELSVLFNTPGADEAAKVVFTRLISNEGPGLLVLWGGSANQMKKVNKGYFLNMVEKFQEEAKAAKAYASPELWDILKYLKPNSYQWVRVKEDSGLPDSTLYQTPLSIVVTLAIAGAASRRGLGAEKKTVILCDDIQKFMQADNSQVNEAYLRGLALILDNQSLVTFLGASRQEWWAYHVLGDNRVLPLGGD
jgi:hypothetical protein